MMYDVPMKIQEYLQSHTLAQLQEEFKIIVTDYPDRVVLNYNQIESPTQHPLCDECRALILRKDTWEVLARSFSRFYNVGEDKRTSEFPVTKARIEEKLDGSLMSVYHDGEKWCVSTRKMAYAEGTTAIGKSFAQLFKEASDKTSLYVTLNEIESLKWATWVFELTAPENRIVTPYSESSITLIGARDNKTGNEYTGEYLDSIAKIMHVKRPKSFVFNSLQEAIEKVKTLNMMDEGFVLTYEGDCGSFWRLKCKNEKYLAIAHMRDNGSISPKRIMTLILNGERTEYLNYFPEDTKYFNFVQDIWDESLNRIKSIWGQNCSIINQKEFALAIIPLTCYDYEKGILFELKKGRNSLSDILGKLDGKKMSNNLGLKQKFKKEFGIEEEE